MQPKCYLDQDGVLSNFILGACLAHDKDDPYDNPNNLGIWEIEDLWGMTQEQFWEPIEEQSFNFWSRLFKMPEADDLVALVTKEFGEENICILTSPSDGYGCVPGKRAWINRHYPQFEGRILFGSAKEFVSGPDKVLIDDKDKNIQKWREAGGHGILVPRAWNSMYNKRDLVMNYVEFGIEQWRRENGR